MSDFPLLIAHRGYSAIAPENTLASFHSACNETIWGVEFDVHLSAEGIPIVIHDSTVDRTTNGKGQVAKKTLAELQSLDAGSWFHPRFASETIPTLEETLGLFSNRQVTLYIEAKSPHKWSLKGINHFIQVLQPWRDRCVILSFDHNFLSELNQQSRQFTFGYLVYKVTRYKLKYLEALRNYPCVLLPHFSLILKSPLITKTLLNQGWEIIPWTVDRPTVAKQLAHFQVVKMITNNLLQVQSKLPSS